MEKGILMHKTILKQAEVRILWEPDPDQFSMLTINNFRVWDSSAHQCANPYSYEVCRSYNYNTFGWTSRYLFWTKKRATHFVYLLCGFRMQGGFYKFDIDIIHNNRTTRILTPTWRHQMFLIEEARKERHGETRI